MASTSNRKLKVFLCHSSDDKPAVREIYQRLKAEGWIDPWLDEEKLYPGQDWDMEIEKAVEETELVVAFLSKNSVSKEGYIQYELRTVLNIAKYKPAGTVFIVPLRLDDCVMPRSLKTWQYVDYFPEKRKDWAYERLLGSLNIRAGKLGVSTIIPAEGKARKERAKKAEDEKAENERIVNEKRIADEKARKEREGEEARKRVERREQQEAQEKEEKRKQAEAEKEKKAAEEKARQVVLKKERQQERVERIRKFFRDMGKLPLFIGGGIALLFLLGYIIGNIDLPAKPEPTKVPDAPLPATATSVLPASTSSPIATEQPTEIPAAATPTLGIGSTMTSEKDGMTLVYVPAGEFQMGSEQYDDEKPVHTVYLDAYWIDQAEVSNIQFGVFVEQSGYETDAEKNGESYVGSWSLVEGADWQHPQGPNSDILELSDHPVVHISWNDAQAYCEWVGRRLPTEAEWEKAAGWNEDTQSQMTYPWGDGLADGEANFCDVNCAFDHKDANYDDGYEETSPVGSFPAGQSFYGTYDMAGNVWEWTSSLYKDYPYDAMDGREDLTSSDGRVLRGGSWLSNDFNLRSAIRFRYAPSYTDFYIGFRCSRSP